MTKSNDPDLEKQDPINADTTAQNEAEAIDARPKWGTFSIILFGVSVLLFFVVLALYVFLNRPSGMKGDSSWDRDVPVKTEQISPR